MHTLTEPVDQFHGQTEPDINDPEEFASIGIRYEEYRESMERVRSMLAPINSLLWIADVSRPHWDAINEALVAIADSRYHVFPRMDCTDALLWSMIHITSGLCTAFQWSVVQRLMEMLLQRAGDDEDSMEYAPDVLDVWIDG